MNLEIVLIHITFELLNLKFEIVQYHFIFLLGLKKINQILKESH